MIDLETLNAFLEVAKTQSMTMAAKSLYVTQSAVSQRIQSMEAFVGQTLFHRQYEGTILNHYGLEVFEICKNLRKDLTIFKDWVDQQKKLIQSHVRITTVSSFIENVFPKFFKKFYKKYHDVKFTIDVNTSEFIEEGVLQGNYDFGIIVGPCKKQSLHSKFILENKVYMVCSKHHPLAKKRKITNDDLKKTKIIWHSAKRSRTVLQVAKKLKLNSIEDAGHIYLSDMESCKAYVLENLGVAFIADNHMHDELKKKKLVKLANFEIDKPAHLIWKKDLYQNSANRTFQKEFLKFCLGEKIN